jgi:hypothetical protein
MKKDLKKELRLGNFVSIEGGHIEFPLTRIRFERVLSNYYDVEPIELTAEWLVRFGFRKSRGGDYILGNFRCDGRMLAVEVGYNDECFLYLGCKHVHTLQNLYFALTGKELVLTAESADENS